MSWILMLSTAAWAGPDGDVARGWYLWRTGRDAEALELARETVEAYPESFPAHHLAIAMGVTAGHGASVEAYYRDLWGTDTNLPLHRVNLATVVSLRHATKGAWCDEVAGLLRPVIDGEAHYWGTRTERLQELRCKGTTDHADAELRRIASDGGIGWADGVLARIDAGYMKPELPDDVEKLWAEHPHRLAEAHIVFAREASGPARGRVRTLTTKALKEAIDGDDPSLVHAAMLTFTRIEKEKRVEEARERLQQLDPEADLELVRSISDIADPPIYAAIDECRFAVGPFRVRDCLLDLEDVPESGPIAAYHLSKLRLAYLATDQDEQALETSVAAWRAEPSHRYNARMVVLDLLGRDELTEEQRPLTVEAVEVAVGDRLAIDPEGLSERRRRVLANDMDLWAEVQQGAGHADEALTVQLDALLMQDTPRRRLRLGSILVDAGRDDDAVLQLVHGIHHEEEDTAAITAARGLLTEVAGDWHPKGLSGMMREISGAPGRRATAHPLVGRRLPDLPALAAPEGAGEGEVPIDVKARVIVTWAPFAAESEAAMPRLEGLAETYGPKGVVFQTVDVGLAPTELSEEARLPNTFGGAEVMRAFRAVSPPTVVVVDARDRVQGVLAPWAWKKIDLEEVLDELVE